MQARRGWRCLGLLNHSGRFSEISSSSSPWIAINNRSVSIKFVIQQKHPNWLNKTSPRADHFKEDLNPVFSSKREQFLSSVVKLYYNLSMPFVLLIKVYQSRWSQYSWWTENLWHDLKPIASLHLPSNLAWLHIRKLTSFNFQRLILLLIANLPDRKKHWQRFKVIFGISLFSDDTILKSGVQLHGVECFQWYDCSCFLHLIAYLKEHHLNHYWITAVWLKALDYFSRFVLYSSLKYKMWWESYKQFWWRTMVDTTWPRLAKFNKLMAWNFNKPTCLIGKGGERSKYLYNDNNYSRVLTI